MNERNVSKRGIGFAKSSESLERAKKEGSGVRREGGKGL
jgi:hypothetical protein